ncbi:MAG: hypothetical protein ACQERZ_09175, partial [Fusobacteriota bacterium]
MSKQNSFTNYENELLPNLREKLNTSEDSVDIANNFSYVSSELLDKIFGENIDIKTDDVVFNPDEEGYFAVSSALLEKDDVKKVFENSDLKNILERFATAAYKHH